MLVRIPIEAEDARIGITAISETKVDTVDVPRVMPKSKKRQKSYEGLTGQAVVSSEDIIGDRFWNERPWLLR